MAGRLSTWKPGDRYGKLTAVRRDTSQKWFFRCECGQEVSIRCSSVRSGVTKSCGCGMAGGSDLAERLRTPRNVGATNGRHSHGGHGSPEYRSWSAMRTRCLNLKSEHYEYYAGRGISVCDRWSSFRAFLEDMGPRPPGTSLDRIDTNGNYEPGNCRWATPKDQIRNRRTTLFVEFEGQRIPLGEACERTGIGRSTARERIARGKPFNSPA